MVFTYDGTIYRDLSIKDGVRCRTSHDVLYIHAVDRIINSSHD